MKKLFILCASLLMIQNADAVPNTMHVINLTTNYTLYYNINANEPTCSLQLSTIDPSNGSGYLIMTASNSISFDDFSGLSLFYPNLEVYQQDQGPPPTQSGPYLPIVADITLLDSTLNFNWAPIYYKVENGSTTEGGWIGFSDFSTCHFLPPDWGNPPITNTYGFTSFTIGGDRYFIVL